MFNKDELQTSALLKLDSYLKERIETLRRNNDGDLEPIQTALVRGRIRELKVLLDLIHVDPAIVEADI